MLTSSDCHLELNNDQRELLSSIIEQALTECRKEEHRSDTFAYREFLKARQGVMEQLLDKLRHCGGADAVEVASDDSFPASDPPSWTPVQSAGPPKRKR